MATMRDRGAKRYMAQVPAQLTKVLRGAARAGADVVADEIKQRSVSHEVADNLTVKTRGSADQITVKISVKPGFYYSLAVWQEYGTAPHFISVDDAQRGGRSVGRINRLNKEGHPDGGSLVIGGKFVGTTVHHPGAQAHPAFRPALDIKQSEAIAAAQRYIDGKVTPAWIAAVDDPEDAE